MRDTESTSAYRQAIYDALLKVRDGLTTKTWIQHAPAGFRATDGALHTEYDAPDGDTVNLTPLDHQATCFCLVGMCERVAWDIVMGHDYERPRGFAVECWGDVIKSMCAALTQAIIESGLYTNDLSPDNETLKSGLVAFNDASHRKFKDIHEITNRAAETYRQRYNL